MVISSPNRIAVRNTFIDVITSDDEALPRSISEPAKLVNVVLSRPARKQDGNSHIDSNDKIPSPTKVHETKLLSAVSSPRSTLNQRPQAPSELIRTTEGELTRNITQVVPRVPSAVMTISLASMILPSSTTSLQNLPVGSMTCCSSYSENILTRHNAFLQESQRYSVRKDKGESEKKNFKERKAKDMNSKTQAISITATNFFYPLSSSPVSDFHHLHLETLKMGFLSEDKRQFTKHESNGRLSLITEDTVHTSGQLRYSIRFTKGDLSSADGVDFIFSTELLVSKNIQKIVSIFISSAGRICLRACSQVIRSNTTVKRLELNDVIELALDLDKLQAEFVVWPMQGGTPSAAQLLFGAALEGLRQSLPEVPRTNSGYLAIMMKYSGTSLALSL